MQLFHIRSLLEPLCNLPPTMSSGEDGGGQHLEPAAPSSSGHLPNVRAVAVEGLMDHIHSFILLSLLQPLYPLLDLLWSSQSENGNMTTFPCFMFWERPRSTNGNVPLSLL